MPSGVKSASAIFQRLIENVQTGDIKNMIIYQDDICIGLTSREELKEKMDYVLNKLKKAGMTINKHKYVLECGIITYLR